MRIKLMVDTYSSLLVNLDQRSQAQRRALHKGAGADLTNGADRLELRSEARKERGFMLYE
jgi:hypothetical protein